MPSEPVVFITGATGSLGRAVAAEFEKQGARLAVVGSRPDSARDRFSRSRRQAPETRRRPDRRRRGCRRGLRGPGQVRPHRRDLRARRRLPHGRAGSRDAGGGMERDGEDQRRHLRQRSARRRSWHDRAQVRQDRHGRLHRRPEGCCPDRRLRGFEERADAAHRIDVGRAEGERHQRQLRAAQPHRYAGNRADMPKADFSKWVAPSDLAAVIAFLCSDGARAIHGAPIPVAGLV